MKRYNIFLDDIRTPSQCYHYTGNGVYLMDDWVVVRSYEDFVKMVTDNGVPTVISFDHDLADFHYKVQNDLSPEYYDSCVEKTGYHCAQWLLNFCLDYNYQIPTVVYIHSMNTIGSKNIASLFNTYKKVHG